LGPHEIQSTTATAAADAPDGTGDKPGQREGTSMSDFDRNVAARGIGAARATVIDAGLGAHMIRIYNYMAARVALTGVGSWVTSTAELVADAAGRITSLTPFGQTIFGGPLTIVL